MITVVLMTGSEVEARAEAEDPESALFAGQTMWNDLKETRPWQGSMRLVKVAFYVDNQLVRIVEGRRPQ